MEEVDQEQLNEYDGDGDDDDDDVIDYENLDISSIKKRHDLERENFQQHESLELPNIMKCLKVLLKLVEHLKSKGKMEQSNLMLVQERLIYASAMLLSRGVPLTDLGFDFSGETILFIQQVNLQAMQTANSLSFEELLLLLTRAIDMLFYQKVYMHVQPFQKVLELRILSFNNLSYAYRSNNQLHDALQAVDLAIHIEEILQRDVGYQNNIQNSKQNEDINPDMNEIVQENSNDKAMITKNGNKYSDIQKNIASTYINKSVIMSELGMHIDSIGTINKALANMEAYRLEWEQNLSEKDAFKLKYLQAIAYFNLAVEHENIFYNDYAMEFYQNALNLSKQLENEDMTKQIQKSLYDIQYNKKK